MKNYMKMSPLYAPTLKEDPSEAELASHRLLLRAGMIRKTAAGLYSYLPLAWRSLLKIEAVIREEMEAIGAQEIQVPMVVPAELWQTSGRWDVYGPELLRLKDRHGRDFVVGPTHEETFVDLVRNELRSYKQLPVTLYQIQDKFRDEMRPRFGLMRGREFIMKDAYSFDATVEGMQKSYEEEKAAYARICERCGLKALPVVADSGQIGGDTSVEFMALAEAGEAELVWCDCDWAADVEAACVGIAGRGGPRNRVRARRDALRGLDRGPRGVPGHLREGLPQELCHHRRGRDAGAVPAPRRPRAQRGQGRACLWPLRRHERGADGRIRPGQGLHGSHRGRPARARGGRRLAQGLESRAGSSAPTRRAGTSRVPVPDATSRSTSGLTSPLPRRATPAPCAAARCTPRAASR